VPTRSVQAGLSAMIAYDAERGAVENEDAMVRVLDGVATGEVTIASRDVTLDGIEVRKGAWLGLADGAAVACDQSFDVVAGAVAERLLDGGRGLLTLLTGADEPRLDELVNGIEARHPGIEIEVHAGGQPHYPLLLSAE
jgi:dihydroxyacetone kinase-like predicted kinase